MYGMVVVAIVSIFGLWLVVQGSRTVFGDEPDPLRVRTSPLSEAERILAIRYARGELTVDTYERALAVLRR